MRKEFSLDDYPDSTWQFIDSKTTQISKGYVPPIHDFSIQIAEGDDITDSVLTQRGYTFLLISPNLEKADDGDFGAIDALYQYAKEQKVPFYCLTASTEQAIKHWEDITGAEYPFYITDETTLKTIIGQMPNNSIGKTLTQVILWFFLPLILLTLADRTWAWSQYIRRKIKKEKAFLAKEGERIENTSNKIISTFKKEKQK